MTEAGAAARTTREPTPLERTHRALRSAMLQLLVRMIEFPRGELYEREQLVDDLDAVLYLCESHAAAEEHVLASVLDRLRAGAYDQFKRVHRGEERAIDALRECCADWLESRDANATRAFVALFDAFASFTVRSLAHFAEEERVLCSLASSALSVDELLSTFASFEAATGPEERRSFSRIARAEGSFAVVRKHAPWLPKARVIEVFGRLSPALEELERVRLADTIALCFGDHLATS